MFSANENIQLRQYKRRVVDYVESTIPETVMDLGVNVMAMQVNCTAPGCVPIETAIVVVFPASATELLPGLPESAGGSYKTKVLKPLAAVERDDVLQALPPAFAGGQRTMERLCRQARDVMLGQITQLFGDTDLSGRTLMAEYLQSSLQEYVERGCEPPEWGAPFPAVTPNREETTTASSETDLSTTSSFPIGKGNVVIQRPVDDEEGTSANTIAVTNASSFVNSSSSLRSPSDNVSSATAKPNSGSVNSVTKRRQQQAATRALRNNTSLLSQLSSREHAPGIRRPGCPCCDPDNLSTVVNQMLAEL